MKKILALAVAACAVTCSAANAATLTWQQTGDAFSFYVANAGTQFNALNLSLKPNGAAVFTLQNSGLQSGAPRPAGQAFSYRNRILDLDPTDPDNPGGLGWNIFGPISTPTELSFGGAPLGQQIDTANQAGGRLFLANVNMPGAGAQGTYLLTLVQGTETVATLTDTFGIPEPASLGLAGLALVGLAGLRRRIA